MFGETEGVIIQSPKCPVHEVHTGIQPDSRLSKISLLVVGESLDASMDPTSQKEYVF